MSAEVILGNCIDIMPTLEKKFDMAFADPPYFMSGEAPSIINGEITQIQKGKWDNKIPTEDLHAFNMDWIQGVGGCIKDKGCMFVSGVRGNIYSVGFALMQQNWKLLNTVIWQKKSPAPRIDKYAWKNCFEEIIFARPKHKSTHTFNYQLMKQFNDGKQAGNIMKMSSVRKWEKECGRHTTQKPLELLVHLILATTKEGDTILDPFNGSGTTGVAAILLKRNYIGIEQSEEYRNLSLRRFNHVRDNIDLYLEKLPEARVMHEDRYLL